MGAKAEEIAANFLNKQGYCIIQLNFYSRVGEIDIIARENGYLVFIEVKYRVNLNMGAPEEAITLRKRNHMIKTARYYLFKNKYSQETPCRFDVVSILGEDIKITKNAFEGYD